MRGREDLDYNDALAGVGLRLVAVSKTASGDNGNAPREEAYLGASFSQDGERLLIRNVLSASPAYDQGLNAGDFAIGSIDACDAHSVERHDLIASI